MTDRDRLYIAACKLPPSAERTEILETVVRVERKALLNNRQRREQAMRTRFVVINGEVFETAERRYRDDARWTQ